MSEYKAPLRDLQFIMHELLGFSTHYAALPGYEEVSVDLIDTVVGEYAKFCENEIAPLNRTGDEEGCTWENGEVTTPSGFREAYQQYIEAGWKSLPWDTHYGGQGLPHSLNKLMTEMLASANMSFTLYASAQPGAIETISTFGTPEQRDTYERKLIEGTWNATMCLTEAHCGTDLGLLRTRAAPNADGSYLVSGTKIFITGGDHDLNENIIHLVLARLPDAPAGTDGISLFIVPKFLPNPDGEPGEKNPVHCGSIEHKMGVKGSATCVMHFEEAKGYLLGEPNRGLHAMFTFINASRISAAIQGVAHAELGFQKSLAYSRERIQMRAAAGPKYPDQPADPIIVHPDVRRMLLTQKAFAEGSRMMSAYLAMQLDVADKHSDETIRKQARNRLEFMTPIAKAFATETGFESANLGLQCFGGHGYIREWGVEQNVRDARIAMLYEGTTGIQALDLLGRKVLGSGGKLLSPFIEDIQQFCEQAPQTPELDKMTDALRTLAQEWTELTTNIGERASQNPDEVGAASVNYLMYAGYVSLAYFWARTVAVALPNAGESHEEQDFYSAKIATAEFYFQQILPRTRTCVAVMAAGSESLMTLGEDQFWF